MFSKQQTKQERLFERAAFFVCLRLMTKADISILLPLASQWVEEQESIILAKGIELNADQQIDAYLAGVKDPLKIRLLKTDQIPLPEVPALRTKLRDIGLLGDNVSGLCLRHGIYIKAEFWNNRRILVHELAHTMQYERLGGIDVFLERYILECLSHGYPFGALEIEARKIEKMICEG
ncbi:MAG: hypothetical protein K0S33_3010 [Bacteroidetes bacterium]|jgi:hypothetical protein|nr:hypothetical protein [Bacteroidota bacterium]